jgi:uncharacterized membrane protein YfhO
VVLNGLSDMPITGNDSSGSVKVVADEPTRLVLRINRRTQPGYLVMVKTFYPGWKATLNGTATPVFRANYGFSAVQIPAGDSEITFYYDPDSVKDGALISLVSVLAVSAILLRLLRRRAS